jgi:hypothetical protein
MLLAAARLRMLGDPFFERRDILILSRTFRFMACLFGVFTAGYGLHSRGAWRSRSCFLSKYR